LNIPEASLVELIQLGLIDLGHVLEVLRVVGIRLLGVRASLFVPHVEPRRRDHGELDIAPLALGHEFLHQTELVEVGLRLLRAVFQLRAGNDRIPRHDFAVLLDQRHYVRMIESEQRGLGVLEPDSAVEFVPHEAPEASPVVFAAGHCLEAQLLLQLNHLSNGLFLDGGQTSRLRGQAFLADGLPDVQQPLGPQEGAHVLGAERRHDRVEARRQGAKG
jgi:hypothetical protein